MGGSPASGRRRRRRWRRPCSLVGAGGRESLSVCEGGKELAVELAARAVFPQPQPGPAAARSPAPSPGRAEQNRAGSGRGHAAHGVLRAEGPLRGDLFPPGRRRLRAAQLPRAVRARVGHPRRREPGTPGSERGLPRSWPSLPGPHAFLCCWGRHGGGARGRSRMGISQLAPAAGGSWSRWLPPHAPGWVGCGAGGGSGGPDRRRTHCSRRGAWPAVRPALPPGSSARSP